MKKINHMRRAWVGIVAVLMVAGLPAAVLAAPQPGRAIVTAITGTAEYQLEGEATWNELTATMALSDGITVRTGKGATVELALTTRALVRVPENASLRIDTLTEDMQGLLELRHPSVVETELTLQRGSMAVEVAKAAAGSSFLVQTPLGAVRAASAKFIVTPTAGGHRYDLRVLDGSVNLELPAGPTVVVGPNQEISGAYNSKTGQCAVEPPARPATVSAGNAGAPAAALASDSRIAGLTELVIKETGSVDLTALAKLVSPSGGFRPITTMRPKPPRVSKSHPAHGGGGGP